MNVDHAIEIFDNAFVLNMEVICYLQGFYTFATYEFYNKMLFHNFLSYIKLNKMQQDIA